MATVFDVINSFNFFLFRDPQANGQINDLEEDKGNTKCPKKGSADTGEAHR